MAMTASRTVDSDATRAPVRLHAGVIANVELRNGIFMRVLVFFRILVAQVALVTCSL